MCGSWRAYEVRFRVAHDHKCRMMVISPTLPLRRHRLWWREQLRDPQQRIAADGQSRDEADLGVTGVLHLAQRAAILAPAEALLDSFAEPLAPEIPGVTGRAPVERRAAGAGIVAGDVRGDPAFAAVGHELGDVIGLVGRERAALAPRQAIEHRERGVALGKAVRLGHL